jgi:putative Mn2+ efflux pump MntP
VNGLVIILVTMLAVWMIAAAYCGYKMLLRRFVTVLCAGLAVNVAWMMLGLNASLTEPSFLITLVASGMYALCAFGCGVLTGRLVRQWRASAVDSGEV